MSNWPQRLNLIHYNIWRFERWTRRLVFGERELVGILSSSKRKKKLDDSSPGHLRTDLPNYFAGHFGFLIFLVFYTLFNCLCGLLGTDADSPARFAGMLAVVALSLIIDFYMVPQHQSSYRKPFLKFESMPAARKRRSGLITLIIVIGIWTMSVVSFLYF